MSKIFYFSPKQKDCEEMSAALGELEVSAGFFDIYAVDFLGEYQRHLPEKIMVRPPDNYIEHKVIFDARVRWLESLGVTVMPSSYSCMTYENKDLCLLRLAEKGVPIAGSRLFMRKADAALLNINKVYKSIFGAAGGGVWLVGSRLKRALLRFFVFGAHPELSMGLPPLLKVFGVRIPILGRSQRHVLLEQDVCTVQKEWRIVRHGNMFFSHVKMPDGDFMRSGSGRVGWERAPDSIFELAYEASSALGEMSCAVDVFECADGCFVNEVQVIYGNVDTAQMYVNDQPGGCVRSDGGDYAFVQGVFNVNGGWNMRAKVWFSL